jgi:Fe(3+) dicitrate transport protein
MNGRYINTDNTSIKGNKVELIPEFTFKTGLTFKYHDKLSTSFLFSSLSEQFTDATNEIGPVPSAVIGLIPSYYAIDFGVSYVFTNVVKLEAGVNNLSNNMYFSRRADGYPGPGIIPSDGRSFYATLQLKLAGSHLKKKK